MTTTSVDELTFLLKQRSTSAPCVKTSKKIEYYNISCAFDIETTSFYEAEEKRATMYIWTFGIFDLIIQGRTWSEFRELYSILVTVLKLGQARRLLVYIHNLAYEFQFIRKLFEWVSVFASDTRKPIYAVTEQGIEFRCSYMLSGYSLSELGKHLKDKSVQKLVGDLDYTKLRHSLTPLTDEEIGYAVNDVKVVMNYISEKIEIDGDVTRIPLTKTGYVRRYCRNSCMYEGSHKHATYKYIDYQRLMGSLTLDPDEYKQLKRAFQGGFTHANAFYSGKTLHNVSSYDFTSSYPSVMVAERFPMSSAQSINITSDLMFRENLASHCCLFDVMFTGLEASTLFEHPLSASRCYEAVGAVEDNGRIVSAESLHTTVTEQDFFILERFYKWKSCSVYNFKRYRRGYLPTNFVKAILKLYEDKTVLKGVQGKELEYLMSKGMANASFGMAVTDICREENTYIYDTWTSSPADIESSIRKYNFSKNRFLFYPWGVWITAYARRNLFSGIYEFKNDYVYSDTDSIKALNADKHQRYIELYNDLTTKKLETALKYHGLPAEAIRPRTVEGVEKPLGVWDYEGIYTRFKTLGAKRYITEKMNKRGELEISITVSGVNKHTAVPYLLETYGERVFEAFNDGLHIPAEDGNGNNPCGKNTHTYIDDETSGELVDYTGVKAQYHEMSCVHLEPTDYSLSLSDAYTRYLKGVRDFIK